MLLTEVYLLSEKNIISESRAKGEMILRGTFQRANEVNQNGRRYKKSILEREVKKLQPMISENRLLGELDHPQTEVVNLANASIMVTGLSWDGDDVIGECKVLNSPAGLTAQALIRDGVKIGVSSRGLGTLTEIGESVKEVNDDYDMRTFDLVADPSTRGAFPGLREGKERQANMLVESTKARALGERVFVTKLTKVLESNFKTKKNMINEAFKSPPKTPGGHDHYEIGGDARDDVKKAMKPKTTNVDKVKAFRDKYKNLNKKIKEGFTTGGSAYATGRRVGKKETTQKPDPRASRIRQKMMNRKPANKTQARKNRISGEFDRGRLTSHAENDPKSQYYKNLEGRTTGGDPTETGKRVGKFLSKRKHKDSIADFHHYMKSLGKASKIGNKINKRSGDYGHGQYDGARDATMEATSLSRKTPDVRSRFAKHLKNIRKGKKGESDAGISNIAARSAKAEAPNEPFGRGQKFRDTITHDIGKKEYQAKKRAKLKEGLTTGGNAAFTGARVGKFLKNKYRVNSKDLRRSERIGKRVEKKAKKSTKASPNVAQRRKEREGDYAYGQYHGARHAIQYSDKYVK